MEKKSNNWTDGQTDGRRTRSDGKSPISWAKKNPVARSYYEIFPCVGKVLPYTGVVFPCAGEVFLCAGEVFPCAGEVFLCTGLVFPCTGEVFLCTSVVFPSTGEVFLCTGVVFPGAEVFLVQD